MAGGRRTRPGTVRDRARQRWTAPARARAVAVVAVGAGVLLLTGCAAGPNDVATVGTTQLAGFWLGLWQGFISPITFLVSLFNQDVSVYEVHNNGGWYDFGFMLGVSMIFGGGPGGAAGRRRARRDR